MKPHHRKLYLAAFAITVTGINSLGKRVAVPSRCGWHPHGNVSTCSVCTIARANADAREAMRVGDVKPNKADIDRAIAWFERFGRTA